MKVAVIPANSDNYQYLIIDKSTKYSMIVDPVDIDSISSRVESESAVLVAALVTHHHWDHASGTKELVQHFNQARIYGGDPVRIEAINKVVKDNEIFTIGNLRVTSLSTPCHTSTHICYFVEDTLTNEKAVFTGDTLFIGGCGRFFEGTAEMMNHALNEKLGNLPSDTKVYCGHEYTVANLEFARTVEPHNYAITEKLTWAKQERQYGRYTVPSTIHDEKTFNPFMRLSEPGLRKNLGTSDDISTMDKLRTMKNSFKV